MTPGRGARRASAIMGLARDATTMITDLVQIRRLGEKKRPENERFRKYLKSRNYVVRRFRQIAEEIEEVVDCTACANCCKVAKTPVTERDIAKLAKYLRTTPGRARRDYIDEDEQDGLILRRDDEHGCIFLDGHLCTVYDARPANCEGFPHTSKGEGSIPFRMWQFIDRATYCPIVYNTLEAWKEEIKFSPAAK
jgi:Fe-S-cluster containining protein